MDEEKHPFLLWLERSGHSQRWAAEQGDFSGGYLSDVLSGKATPSVPFCAELATISDGKVPAVKILRWHWARKHGRNRPL